jgi:CubicO group peptidase (beta-lactamase class C family)
MEVGMHTRIGSVTKTFVGTLLMQLAQDGELSLDDTIDEYVDGVPNGDRITLRMLADMTSGVASYTLTQEFFETLFTAPETIWTPQEVLQIGLDASPLSEPGEQFYYSNTNTILLGMVIEEVTGQPIEVVLQQRIFDPLRLEGTSWPGDSTAIPEPSPQGYTLQGFATPDDPDNTTHWNVTGRSRRRSVGVSATSPRTHERRSSGSRRSPAAGRSTQRRPLVDPVSTSSRCWPRWSTTVSSADRATQARPASRCSSPSVSSRCGSWRPGRSTPTRLGSASSTGASTSSPRPSRT